MLIPVIVQVCRSCRESPRLIAQARDLEKQYGGLVALETVNCLDCCHYPPAMAVDGALIVMATHVQMREAVARAVERKFGAMRQ